MGNTPMNNAKAERAVNALPALNRYAEQATRLAEGLLSREIHCDIDNDHFGFMALCFLGEQAGYLRAISELVQRGLGKPAGLVARSMVEGMVLLRWAQADPDRPLRWRLYVWIVDFRTMMRDTEGGMAIKPQQKARIEEALRAHGDQFLTSKARKNRDTGKRLPMDPYVRSWYAPNSLSAIFNEVEGAAKPLYEFIYRAESERTHWSVGSLGRNVHRTEKGVVYAGDSSPKEEATALAAGFQALIETLQDVDTHFKLARSDVIRKLRDEYVEESDELLG